MNYKAGKKYVKAVSRAINRANGTPRVIGRKGELPPRQAPSHWASPFATRVNLRPDSDESEDVDAVNPDSQTPPGGPVPSPLRSERQSLAQSPGSGGNYGSFVPTPTPESPLASSERQNTFELPAPALTVSPNPAPPRLHPTDTLRHAIGRLNVQRSTSHDQVGSAGQKQSATLPRPSPLSHQNSSPGRLRRLFSSGHQLQKTNSAQFGYGLQALDTVRQREMEFFEFLDSELDKVESFYRQKEEQAGQRLAALRDQLHEMRNRRTQELAEHRRRKHKGNAHLDDGKAAASGFEPSQSWMAPIKSAIFKPGRNSKALSTMPVSPGFAASGRDARRDYIRRPGDHDVPYRTAKRTLKLSLQEFYRGLELLKSYTLLNRTAFRKLNKKYDKAVKARPPYRYMNEKVNRAWFVNSDIVDGHIRAVEDLYARYFEKGNHKLAAGKLRRVNRRPGDESGISFRNGLLLGVGAVFAIQGAVYGTQLLFHQDPVVRERTSYLMQIYGGYFLMLYLCALFCIDCWAWTANKINYTFIFEFDPRSTLDWRQLASFPSLFLFLFGIFIWVNFMRFGDDILYLYYPVILIAISLAIILMPAPILWHKSRMWLAYSHYRLFFAGLYPVEFRDLFLGDIYCSLTYATSNIELLFCIYAHWWDNPAQCNSSSSRLLGFFSALPPIWRALQCIRRYYDTKAVFPHLVNCGKYIMTIMSAVTLSLYRINGTSSNLGLFITFSAINAIYTSIWDLFMDFSLLQPDSRHRFLRDILGLKRRWLYYAVMILDPILRFSWIFYAIFTYDKDHKTIVSFLVAFAEVTRRGMWALFRVENEHCSNVAQYKASRELPLPYHLEREPLFKRSSSEGDETVAPEQAAISSTADPRTTGVSTKAHDQLGGANLTQAQTHTTPSQEESGTVRRRRPERPRAKSIRGIMAEAHTQDFEKKKRQPEPHPVHEDDASEDGAVLSEEEDDDDTGSMLDERMEVRRVEELVRGDGAETDGD
ncbi:EXS-domain-containing protein [Xylariomycetidae sp. FL2044]|nr:EXS-domain-containing protein [Xylariomycetidae sp. FL2044]